MTIDELRRIAETERAAQNKYPHRVCVCIAAGCLSSGADHVRDALQREVAESGMRNEVLVKGVGCMGLCSAGPLVAVETQSAAPAGTQFATEFANQAANQFADSKLFANVTPGDAPELIRGMDTGVNVTGSGGLQQCPTNVPFFERQKKIVLENSGKIDPERIEDYIASDGYVALVTAITEMTPQEVIDQLLASGLRGRGGAGYPTGLKWSTVAKTGEQEKYVICNADEGDPGAFMDRAVLESDPHRVLEGMAIAAYAVGAQKGFIYVRAEYPLAVKHLKTAIKQAERMGLLGNNLCGTRFSFHLDIRLGAGAFVCGEETALIESIEGKRGTPRPRPPYPAEEGLWGCPTLINNVETFANVAPILRNGADWFAGIGTEKSKGTKVFALAGRVENTGLIEVPMGITLREIIFDIGGGIPEGKQYKAVQTGGPSGGCIPAPHLDSPVDYESLARIGSIMGSGGMIVMDETSCMVDVAKYFMEFCMSESCGKCVPCRAGTQQMHGLLEKIAGGEATPADLALLEELCDLVRSTSLCGLGQCAPNPIVTTLKYFRKEYEDHIAGAACPTCHTAEHTAGHTAEHTAQRQEAAR
jgi:bidirectional [NiFe] hydrogenase diaphorase subunit